MANYNNALAGIESVLSDDGHCDVYDVSMFMSKTCALYRTI